MATTKESGGSTYVFAWAWDVDKDADDFLAVVGVDRRSATYGQVVRTLPAPGGRGAHHVEYEMSTSQLFANSFETGRSGGRPFSSVLRRFSEREAQGFFAASVIASVIALGKDENGRE